MNRLSVGILVVLVVSMLAAGCGSSGAQQKAPEEREALTQPAQDDETRDEHSDEPRPSASVESTEVDESPATDDDDHDELPLYAVGPVAVVDGEEISADSFNALISQRTGAMGGNISPRIVGRLKTRTVDRLIDEHLIKQRMATVDIDVDAQEVEQEWVTFKERFPTDEAFDSFVNSQGLDEAQFKSRLKEDLKLRKLIEDKYDIEVTEEDARKHYDDNPKRYERKEEVRARHILIKTERGADPGTVGEARKRADEIAARAQEPDADFAELAKEESEGPSARRGGDLGFFSRERMVSEFSAAAFDMQPGEISGPVKSQFGFHIIKVEERKEAGVTPFEEAKDGIVDQLMQNDRRRALKTFMAELKDAADIVRHEDNIEVNVDTSEQGQPQSTGRIPPELQEKLREQMKQRELKIQKQEETE